MRFSSSYAIGFLGAHSLTLKTNVGEWAYSESYATCAKMRHEGRVFSTPVRKGRKGSERVSKDQTSKRGKKSSYVWRQTAVRA